MVYQSIDHPWNQSATLEKYTKIIPILPCPDNFLRKKCLNSTASGFAARPNLLKEPVRHSSTTLTFLLDFDETDLSKQRLEVFAC
jgi:hypothetical protein